MNVQFERSSAASSFAVGALAACGAAMASLLGTATPADAKDPKYTIYAGTCRDDPSRCGVIAYINEGGYVVNPTKVKALSSQPDISPNLRTKEVGISPECAGVAEEVSADIDIAQFVAFVLPADCVYNLKINIKTANKKDRDLFLIPGCQIEMSTDGTVWSNEWHMKVKWTDKAKKKGQSGPVVDGGGYACGKYSKSGAKS